MLAETAGVEPAGSRRRLPLEMKSNRLTGDDDLPRLDCYMEAGRIIATFNRLPHLYLHFSASFYSPACVSVRNI
ncbi:transposase [Kluyvera genomosp. 2]|uniref:Transposase n=1 Tax=Kluyvera genomosp. 2 TaxID=2774054 RepID=A0A2T2Y599_9ENTR|nr:transposase [Kluyvera genomosp. 2]